MHLRKSVPPLLPRLIVTGVTLGWTTFELLDIERRALATAKALLGVERAVCPDDAVLAALRSTPSPLSDEQATARTRNTPSQRSRADGRYSRYM